MTARQMGSEAIKRWGKNRIRVIGGVTVLALLIAVFASIPKPAVRAATADWPTYLGNNGRTGFNAAETILNQNTAPGMKLHWSRKISSSKISAQPVEVNGVLYWGSWDGVEHATNPSNGVDIWATTLGPRTPDCRNQSHGVLSSATVASMLIGGVLTPVVFVGGNDVQIYALNANNGTIIWHTPLGTAPNYFLYSSPAVYNGSVYIGVSADGDCNLIQGQMVQLDEASGVVQHVFNTVPTGCTGASVWSSPTIDEATGMLYLSTGEKGSCSTSTPMAIALVALHASDLSLAGSWHVPSIDRVPDGDFGSTPTLFQAIIGGVSHQMVGLENKNGFYYAFDRTTINTGPLWQVRVAVPGPSSGIGDSISSSAWDGSTLYVSAAQTTINSVTCAGSLRALNPSNGAFLWEDCLGIDAKDPVTAVTGLVALGVGTSLYVVNASTGSTLFTYLDSRTRSNFWGPAMISNGMLFEGNADGFLYAFGL